MRRPPVPPGELDEVLEGHARVLEGLRDARILLTGGTGFLGTWMVELLLRARARHRLGTRLVLLTRDPEAFRDRSPHLAGAEGVELLRGGLMDFPDPGPLDLAVHGAAPAWGPEIRDPRQVLATLEEGTRRTLLRVKASGARRLLYVSSGAVYGPQPADVEALPEDHPGAPDPLDPRTAYGQGKRIAEHLCALACQEGPALTVARGFAFLGPHLPLDAHFAAGNFIRDALVPGPVRVQGDGTPLRSWLYGSDMAMAHLLVLLAGRPGRAYNVGSPQAASIADLARAVAAGAGQAVEILGTAPQGAKAVRYVPDVGRLARELGFQARVDLPEAIRRTLAWHRMGA